MIITYSPKHKVVLRRVVTGRQSEDISKDVIQIQTHKGYGSAGSFDLVLTYARRDKQTYDRIIAPGDLLSIQLDAGSGKGLVKVMLGIVSSVERHKQIDGSGIPRMFVHVSGGDFVRILQRHHCLWPAAIRKDNEGAVSTMIELIYQGKLYAGGTPSNLAKAIIAEEMYTQMPWTKDYLDISFMESDDDWQRQLVPISTAISVWDVLKSISNPPYNMLHIESEDDGRAHVYIEKQPFDNSTGKLSLEADLFHRIDPADVVKEQIGVNDTDRVSYLYNRVNATMFGEPSNPVLYVRGDNIREASTTDKENFGFLPLYFSTVFTPLLAEGPPTPSHLQDVGGVSREPIRARTESLWNWFKGNHTYESGIFETLLRPDIRSGEGIIYSLNGFEYFTEQISHVYSLSTQPFFRTTIHVTRGQRHEY